MGKTSKLEKKQKAKKRDGNSTKHKSKTEAKAARHKFTTDPLDHCESPGRAFEHITTALQKMCTLIGKCPADLVLWDPYYCDGSVKKHMATLGFPNMIHKNKDFYKLIAKNKIPEHAVFMTNPPYSEDHIERLLRYLSNSAHAKFFCLLMPNWVARKKDYKSLLTKDVFYLSPITPYIYEMPSWNNDSRPEHVGEDGKTRPYLSSWYIHAGIHTESLLEKLSRVKNNEWVTAKTIKGLKWKIQKLAKGKK